MLFGFVLRRQCTPQPNRNVRFTDGPLTPADFEDWRVVEFVDADSNPSQDLTILMFVICEPPKRRRRAFSGRLLYHERIFEQLGDEHR